MRGRFTVGRIAARLSKPEGIEPTGLPTRNGVQHRAARQPSDADARIGSPVDLSNVLGYQAEDS
jgi:hypothetical protein